MRALKISEAITTRESETFKQYLREVANIELFESADAEAECATKAARGCKKSIDELVNRNLRFVISVAKQYVRPNTTLEDLVNEGNIGLMYAATKFDPTQGNKFISYAVWHIRKEILRALYNNERQIRVPNNKLNGLNNLNKIVHELEQKLGRSVHMNDILASTDDVVLKDKLSKEDIIGLMEVSAGHATSIDNPINEDGSTLHELMPSTAFAPTDYGMTHNEEHARLNQLIDTLDDTGARVLRMFFGIGYDYEYGLLEIGHEFGVSRERIRQIKEASLIKLQKAAKGYGFNELKLV